MPDSPPGAGALVALLALIVASLWLGTAAQRAMEKGSFLKGFFLGNRGLGAWALALTATVQSGGTFMGFPSLVYSYGWIVALWIASYMVVPITGFGVLAKRFSQLSRETGVNLVIDPRHAGKVKETVTLKLDEVPLEIAVRLISEIAGLRSVRQANVIFVTSKEVAAELRKEEGVGPESPVHPLIESIRFMGGGGNAAPPVAAPVVQPAAPAPKDK